MNHTTINKIIDLDCVKVKKVVHTDTCIKLFLETRPYPQTCPVCGLSTCTVHDYRLQTIKDLPMQMKHCFLVLRKRRYRCSCGKRFYESYSFLPKYFHRTKRLTAGIANAFYSTTTVKAVAELYNVSPATVARIISYLNFPKPHLPETISIDEFRGNAGNEKFQTIITDPINHRILDILPSRNSSKLSSYFRDIPKSERYAVKFFSCDMSKSFKDLAQTYFPNAIIVIDRYHFVRQVYWALDNVRKRIQSRLSDKLRKYFKRSRYLLRKPYSMLSKEDKQTADIMLLYSDDLRRALWLKEKFREICNQEEYSLRRAGIFEWIKAAEQSGLKEFEKVANTYRNWSKYILNSLKYTWISNGPTEGFNNKIKVIKRISYGIRNFRYFRTRILMATAK